MVNKKYVLNGNYEGGRCPFRRGSKDYEKWYEDYYWFMDNLNLEIVTDYLKSLSMDLIHLRFENEKFERKINDFEYEKTLK
jgi:hypothetical protein